MSPCKRRKAVSSGNVHVSLTICRQNTSDGHVISPNEYCPIASEVIVKMMDQRPNTQKRHESSA